MFTTVSRRIVIAAALTACAGLARAQDPTSWVITIDSSTTLPVATGFTPANVNGSVIVLAQGAASTSSECCVFDGRWHDAAGVTRLDAAGQPNMSGIPHGALTGGFSTDATTFRYLGSVAAWHLLPANVGHELNLSLNIDPASVSTMQGQIKATVIYLPDGSASVSQVVLDAASPRLAPTGLLGAGDDQFVVIPYGAVHLTTGGDNPYTGSWSGPEGRLPILADSRPRPDGPYAALLGTFGDENGAFHIGNGGCWTSQIADQGYELKLLFNVTSTDQANLEGQYVVNVFKVPSPTSNVGDPAQVGAHRLTAGPNPASASSTVRFTLQESGPALLRVADVNGRWVRTLVDEEQSAGAQSVEWDGRDDSGRALPAGSYFCQLSTTGGSSTARIVIAH